MRLEVTEGNYHTGIKYLNINLPGKANANDNFSPEYNDHT